jgi:hypothetical protein
MSRITLNLKQTNNLKTDGAYASTASGPIVFTRDHLSQPESGRSMSTVIQIEMARETVTFNGESTDASDAQTCKAGSTHLSIQVSDIGGL